MKGMTDIKNKYEIRDDILILFLEKRNGDIFETKVDLDEFEKLDKFNHKWSLRYDRRTKTYYVQCNIYSKIIINNKHKSTTLHLHIFIMNSPKGYKVDHINHDTLDNRKSNLRIVKNIDNTKNRKSKNSNNTSGYRNVSRIGNLWYVQLQINGVHTILKKFSLDKLDDAGAYAKEMRQKYYGEFAGNS